MKKAVLIAGVLATLAGVAAPADAKRGDLYITGIGAPGEADVVRMDARSGETEPVAELPGAGQGYIAAFGKDGRLYITDISLDVIYAVNTKSGGATVFSEDPALENPFGLDVAPNGRVLVSDSLLPGVFGFTPPSPVATPISTGGDVSDVNGVAATPSAAIYAVNVVNPPTLVRVDPRSGDQEVVAELADGLGGPNGITAAPSGILYLTRNASIERYAPKTDSVTTTSASDSFDALFDLDLGFDGKLYAVEEDAGFVHRVSPKTGSHSIVGEHGLVRGYGVAIEPPRCAGRFATVFGTNKKDKIKGSKGPDTVAGLKGNDKIKGLKGKDRICGGAGKDKLIGGPSRDKLKGGAGKDVERQ